MKQMYSLDYIKEHKKEILSPYNFKEADLPLLSLISLVDIAHVGIPKENENKEGATLKSIVDKQFKLHKNRKLGLIIHKNLNNFFLQCSKAERYKNLKFYNLFYKVDENTQSTFLMCDLSSDVSLVMFCGTDDTVTGWMENFKLLINPSVECLENAKEYVNRNCRDQNKKYIFIGHSKGGMLSAYAFLECDKEIQDNILVAYDEDGTGFAKDFANKHKENPVLDRLKLICPQSSVVGRLFYQPMRAIVVKSSARGLNQHDPLTWLVDEEGNYVRYGRYSKRSTIREVMVKKYIDKLSKKESEDLYNAIYKIANAGNAKTLTQAFTHPFRMLLVAFRLPKAEKRAVLTTPYKMRKIKRETKKEMKKNKEM